MAKVVSYEVTLNELSLALEDRALSIKGDKELSRLFEKKYDRYLV